jgi:hypothetical protein
MNTSRAFGGAGGTTTAAFVATGRINPTSVTTNTELWNGTSWTEVNNVNTGRFSTGGGIGTQTAGLIAPGSTVPTLIDSVESWDGTNWTAVTTYPGSAKEGIMLFGTNTSAIFAGGYGGPSPRGGDTLYKDAVFEWNGSTFSAETNLPTIRGGGAGVGTTTDGLVSGGWEGSVPAGGTVTNTTHYNGTTWTELNNLATAAQGWGSSKGGTTSDTIVFGGGNALTEEWTTAPAPSFQQENLGQVFYNSTSNAFKVTQQPMPGGSWSSGGSLNTARRGAAGAGIQTSALSAGGGEPAVTNTELYNGSSWSEVNDLSTARRLIAGLGLQTAALAIGGFAPPTTGSTEEFDGTNWTAGGSLNTARYGMAAAGIQTAGIAFGGDTPNVLNESYNGTSWTEVGDLNTGGTYLGGFGLQTAAIAVKSATVESWNGTSWTEVNDLNTGRTQMGCSGIQTAGLAFGGSGPSALTESWNGTSWTEVADLATARTFISGSTSAPNTTSLAFGGSTGSDTGATEEWNVPTTNSTLTAS